MPAEYCTDPRFLGMLSHGHCRNRKVSRAYQAWKNMRDRCKNPRDDRYARYGGRGIKVCERWEKSFENFLADMGEPPAEMTLDRIDSDGNYEPTNCRWADRKTQQRNMMRNRLITFRGITQCVAAWAEQLGIRQKALGHRLARGWSLERALTTPNLRK